MESPQASSLTKVFVETDLETRLLLTVSRSSSVDALQGVVRYCAIELLHL